MVSLLRLAELAAIRWGGAEQNLTISFTGKTGWAVSMGEDCEAISTNGHKTGLEKALEDFLIPRLTKGPQTIEPPQGQLFTPEEDKRENSIKNVDKERRIDENT